MLVSKDIQEKTFAVGSQGAGGVDSKGKKWKTGELEFEAIMRLLDNAVRLTYTDTILFIYSQINSSNHLPIDTTICQTP